ncbi:MAG: PhzF family phenazine biosynthesis protein [Dinoroseobacter sp.]|nr:PhzF family phenazine biosynthesis protein [Dinoroseobacter sp.]
MRKLDFFTYDVFTKQAYSGNPLAIVEGAEGLGTLQMQAIAREFNLSETVFVMPPVSPEHTARVRIFFPIAEIPFAGHPTIGCAIHLATQSRGAEDFTADLVLEEAAGNVPVRVSRAAGVLRAELQAPVLPHMHTGRVDHSALAPALGLTPEDIGFCSHDPSVLAGGPAFLYVPVSHRDALRRAQPQEPHWSSLMAAGEVDSAYLYCRSGTGFEARMFSPTAGIPEDPATGSASAILAAQLLQAGELADEETNFELRQGTDMGRPSEIVLRIIQKNGALSAVYVSGHAVPVMSGTLTPPPN